jgi:hypothetical protein
MENAQSFKMLPLIYLTIFLILLTVITVITIKNFSMEGGNRIFVFIHLPLIRRAEEWRDVASRGVRRPGGR